ncbi:EEV membrane glycoprotein [Borealpox virus]|nr:EEV membrane glycoprotein [Alaskapox virus]
MKTISVIALLCLLPIVYSSKCTIPPTMNNAKPRSSELSDDNIRKVTFICDPGYYSDDPYAICKNGNWVYNNECNMCIIPDDIYELYTVTLYPPLSVLTIECGDGVRSFVCEEKNGKTDWNETITCSAECSQPLIEHGSYQPIKEKYAFGEHVTIVCDSGYENIGDMYVICDSNNWRNSPICQQKCDVPSLPNGIITGSKFFIDSVIQFSCKSDFTLIGQSSSTCIDGKWNPELPTCERTKKMIYPAEEDEPNYETDISKLVKDVVQYEREIKTLETTYHTIMVITTIIGTIFLISIIVLIYSCNNSSDQYVFHKLP